MKINSILLLLPLTLTFALQGALRQHIDPRLPLTLAFPLQEEPQLHEAEPATQYVNWKLAYQQRYQYPEFTKERAEIALLHPGEQEKITNILPTIATMDIHEFLPAVALLTQPQKHVLLCIAAQYGLISIARALLVNGADVNYCDPTDHEKNTALIWASTYGQTEIAQLFLEHNVDVNAVDAYGNTALMWATIRGCGDLVQLLLQHGAHTHPTDKLGNTALLKAARDGHLDIVESLLLHKADVKHANEFGHRACDMAGKRYPEIRALLKEKQSCCVLQ